jgi:PAS domain S-box-containing protein
MSWIHLQPKEVLEEALRTQQGCFLAAALDGRIFYANDAFLRWIGYTMHELESRTWMDISVKDINLEADLAAAKAMGEGSIQYYSVQKQYIPKQSRPRWGTLYVQRYPQIGPCEVALVTWEPLEEETSEAYLIAKDAIQSMSSELVELKAIVKKLEASNEPTNLIEKGVIAWLKIVANYPKSAAVVGLFLICLIGGSAAVNAIGAVKKIMTGDFTANP